MAKEKMAYLEDAKKQRQREDERFTYRILITFGVIAVILVALMRLDAAIIEGRNLTAIHEMSRLAAIIGAACTVVLFFAACVLYWNRKSFGAALCGYGAALSGIAAISGLYSMLYLKTTYFDSMLPLYIVLPSAALLYLLMFIYSREFILQAVLAAGGAVGFWLLKRVLQRREGTVKEWLAIALFAAFLCLAVGFIAVLRKKKGSLTLAGRSLWLLPADSRYRMLFATCLLLALGLAATILLGWMAAWVSMISLLVYVFLIAIYYTTRLI